MQLLPRPAPPARCGIPSSTHPKPRLCAAATAASPRSSRPQFAPFFGGRLLLAQGGCVFVGAGRRRAAVLGASAVLLFPVEDGYDLGQGLVVADVAGEDDVGHADGLGCGIDGAE